MNRRGAAVALGHFEGWVRLDEGPVGPNEAIVEIIMAKLADNAKE